MRILYMYRYMLQVTALYLSIYLSIYLPTYLSIYLSICTKGTMVMHTAGKMQILTVEKST